PTLRGVNLCIAAFPPCIGSGIRPGRAPSDRGFFFSDRLETARGEQQPVPLGMRQGLAHRLVFEQDGKLFRPVVVENVSTHLEKVHWLAWLGEPKALGLAVSVPALIDGPIGKTLLQVFTHRIDASAIDLWHIRPPGNSSLRIAAPAA